MGPGARSARKEYDNFVQYDTVIRTKLRRPADASEYYKNNIYIQFHCTDL